MPHFEDDMDKPVTKRELREVLNETFDERLEPYATKQDVRETLKPHATREETKADLREAMDEMREYVKQQCQLVVDAVVTQMTKLMNGMEDRIAASVWSGLEMRVGAAVGAVEDKLVPRIKRLEDKVFPPKRQRRR